MVVMTGRIELVVMVSNPGLRYAVSGLFAAIDLKKLNQSSLAY